MEERTFAFAFPENRRSNMHFHMPVRVEKSPRPSTAEFERAVEAAWRGRVKSGTVDVQRMYDRHGAIRYSIKQILRRGNLELYIISSEFHPTRPKQKKANTSPMKCCKLIYDGEYLALYDVKAKD